MKILPTKKAARQNGFGRFTPWLAVLVVVLFTGFIRVRLLEVPLERDEGEYAYAGQLILQGIPPYQIAYNMKLPGTYLAYAAGMALFGQNIAGIHLTLLVVNSLTCIFLFLLARKLSGVTTGWIACVSYALMSMSPAVFGLAAHATQFVVLFAVPGILLLLKANETGNWKTLFGGGLLLGLAFLMKQPGICFGIFGLVFLAWEAARKGEFFSKRFAGKLLAFGTGLILPYGLACLWLAAAGVFGQFWFWTSDYAANYATGNSLVWGIHALAATVSTLFPVYAGFWILAAVGVPLAMRDKEKRRKLAFALALLFFSFLGTTPGFYFRAHYFVLVLPAFAIVLGLAMESLQMFCARWRMQFVPLVLLGILLGWNTYQQRWVFFKLIPSQVVQAVYPHNPFGESLVVARYIREHTKPEARIAVLGSEPQLYFYANRHSATGYIYTYPLMEPQPYASEMQQKMIKEIEAAKPEFIVYVKNDYSWVKYKTSDLAIFHWAGQYTSRFYELVGVVGQRPNGQYVTSMSDFGDSIEEYTALFQLKSDVN